jgi:hypothetical protein
VSARRYLVRLFASGIPKWFEDDPDVEDLAKKAFDLAGDEHSVYEVADGEEECLTVAAHRLADPRKSLDAMSVPRIDRADLDQLGIRVEEEFGTTGVPRWDGRHRNLRGNRDQLLALVRFLAGRCQRGHDQVRRIEKLLVVRSLKVMCHWAPGNCPDHIKLIAHWCQRSDKSARPGFSLEQIEQEVAGVQFEDELIRPRAYQLATGDQASDWFAALNALRRAYADQYTPAIRKRFGLRLSANAPGWSNEPPNPQT